MEKYILIPVAIASEIPDGDDPVFKIWQTGITCNRTMKYERDCARHLEWQMPDRFQHQEAEWEHRYDVSRAFLWQMRTGKTRMAVEHASALHDSLAINGVVVIAPNGVHRQWCEQIHMWGRGQQDTFAWRYSNLNNKKEWAEWRKHLQEPIPHWLCINMEVLIKKEIRDNIEWFKKQIGSAMLICDESHHFSKPGAKRTSVARWLGHMFEYRRILTGTVMENSPFGAFSQFEILERGALGHTTFNGTSPKSKDGSRYHCPTCGKRCRGFKNEFATFYMGRHGFEVDEYQNLDILKQRMAKYASVVLRSDCEDLPALQLDHRIVEMEPTQQKWWDTVKNQELEDISKLGQERVFDGGAALVKLQQVEGGFWRHADGKIEPVVPLKNNPKMLILLDEIQWHDGQVIAWFEYLHEIDAAQKFLQAAGIKCGVFSGRNVGTRDRDLAAFRRGEVLVLLGQPRAGGEGRDMSVATKIIRYSQTPDAIVRTQSNERATKMGAKSVQIVDMIAPVGKYFLSIATRKTTLANDVARDGLRAVLESLK